MLTVWTVWWRDPAAPDKYSAYHVQRMRREVKKHLTLPHRFICITDQSIDQVITMQPLVDWPGWWQKLQLFRPGVATKTNLYIDLDCVVTGSLDEFVTRYGDQTLAAPLNWAASGHGGVQSSLMVWKQSKYTLPIYRNFRPEWARWPPVNDGGTFTMGGRGGWGDQEFLTACRDSGQVEITPTFPPLVRSYKYHLRGKGLSHDCRLAVFHGDPKPDSRQVAAEAKWFRW